MTLTEMQCVYFFKQFQLDGSYLIKIGMTTKRSPEKRLSSLKTYSPYGCELLGFIIIKNASKLEKELHKRFESLRLNGEWFCIDENKCHNLIKHYNKPQQNVIKKMFAEFMSKELNKKLSPDELISDINSNNNLNLKEKISKILEIKKDINKSELAKKLGVSRQSIYNYL